MRDTQNVDSGRFKMTSFVPDQSKLDDFLPSQDKKLYRKKKILSLKLRGKKNWEISEKLGYSLSTIEKDLHEIRRFFGGLIN